ncbi:hypothetical protein AB0B57_34145 [Micromonospora sp. NPDC049101]|uniref:hypothetical protein n=1 Tax=Micromonospora sp. NPDC049101 TaxID=3155032 RepID=UPI00340B6E62
MTDVFKQSSHRPPVTAGCVRLQSWWCHDNQTTAWNEQQIRRCDEVLHSLTMPATFSVGEFCAELQRARGRRLVVKAVRTCQAEARAMWCRGATTDHILIGSALPRLHRDYLVLHGIGHMVFAHVGSPAVGRDIRRALHVADMASLRRDLKRVVYTHREEHQAELFATRVLQVTNGWVAPKPPSGSQTLLLAQLSSVLEYHPGRAER